MRTYGLKGTIHSTTHLDIEVNKKGQVVAVWFRCQTLPFKQSNVDQARSNEMTNAYAGNWMPELHAVQLKDNIKGKVQQ